MDGQYKAEAVEVAWAAWMMAVRYANQQAAHASDFLDIEAQRAEFERWWSEVDRWCSCCGCVTWGDNKDELHDEQTHARAAANSYRP